MVLREPLRLVVLEPCTTSISSKAPTTTGRTTVFFSTRPPRKGRSPAYDLTLDADEGRDYLGLTPNTFGSAPRLTTLAAVAADPGIGRDEFDKIDAEVSAVIQRWPEFAAAAELPAAVAARAAAIHLGVANSLATEVTAKRGKRRKLWE